MTEEPQTTTNWAKGAEGERKLGAGLDKLAGRGVLMLHDRRRPGTTANIDHLAVAPTGVWVIDAKRYTGQVTKKDVGGWFSSDVRLFVGRRDCTKLVTGTAKQVDAVRTALGAEWADVPVRPVLCFVDTDWRWFASPFEFDGVLVTWPRAIRELRSQLPGDQRGRASSRGGRRCGPGDGGSTEPGIRGSSDHRCVRRSRTPARKPGGRHPCRPS